MIRFGMSFKDVQNVSKKRDVESRQNVITA